MCLRFLVSFDFSFALNTYVSSKFYSNSVYILSGALHAVAEDVRYLALQVLKDDEEEFEDTAQT